MTDKHPSEAVRDLEQSLDSAAPPPALDGCLLALWHAGRDEWDRAHDLVQDDESAEAAWIHAWLHRQEGDLSNAAYWYRRAGRPEASGDLRAEWRGIAAALLGP